MMNASFEVCKRCGREQRLAWSVKNSLWNKVVPSEYRDKVLCLECFLEIADEQHVNIKNKDFIFFGWIGENIRGDVLIERTQKKTRCIREVQQDLG